MRISIAMCTWNGISYLAEQLNSIAEQTRIPDELIICDDLSTDNTRTFLSSFASKAAFPVRIFNNQTRLGSSDNFNKAISHCEGELIVLSDQDDIWIKEKLAIIENNFEANPDLGGLFTDAELIDQYGDKINDYLWNAVEFGNTKRKALRNGRGLDILIQGNFITGATLAFRSCWKDLLMPIPSGWVHDYWIVLLLAAASCLDFESKPLIQYRCHPTQQLGLGIRCNYRGVRLLLRLAEIDNATYLRSAQRCDEIIKRLKDYDPDHNPNIIMRCLAKSTHFRSRGALPKTRIKRLPIVLKETLNGNYFRHSFGIKSILRDLLSDFRHGTYNFEDD